MSRCEGPPATATAEADMAIGWKLYGDGKTPPLGHAVAPEERLSWGRTAGFGAQHVVAMFGGTFVFPLVMGLDPNLALMMSGIGTILFLLIVAGRVPSYLGTSASFVGGVAAIRGQGGSSADVVGAILVSGIVLALVGLAVQRAGARVVNKVLPPAVTGAVVLLIGLNLASVAATVYWPQDQWLALITMVVVIVCSLVLRGFLARIAILLALVAGYVLSWIADKAFGTIDSITGSSNGEVVPHFRTDFSGVGSADWIGLPHFTAPHLGLNYALLVLPAVIALIAENAGHVKAVGEIT